MATHEKAWQGLNFVILGKTPLLPMQIEQAIAAASPANEVKLDSFEEYDAAYDFCKKTKSVGFLILLDNAGSMPLHDVFRQLARHYEERGWPCFGVVLHEGKENFVGYRAMQLCPQLLDYLPASELLDGQKVYATLQRLWDEYVNAFERHVLPKPLQESIYALAEPALPATERLFLERATVMLTANLNVSWLESFALRWAPVIEAVHKTNPAFWETLKVVRQICDLAKAETGVATLDGLKRSQAALPARVATLLGMLHQQHRAGTLAAFVRDADSHAKPGAPALIRHLAKAGARLIAAADEVAAGEKRNQGA